MEDQEKYWFLNGPFFLYWYVRKDFYLGKYDIRIPLYHSTRRNSYIVV